MRQSNANEGNSSLRPPRWRRDLSRKGTRKRRCSLTNSPRSRQPCWRLKRRSRQPWPGFRCPACGRGTQPGKGRTGARPPPLSGRGAATSLPGSPILGRRGRFGPKSRTQPRCFPAPLRTGLTGRSSGATEDSLKSPLKFNQSGETDMTMNLIALAEILGQRGAPNCNWRNGCRGSADLSNGAALRSDAGQPAPADPRQRIPAQAGSPCRPPDSRPEAGFRRSSQKENLPCTTRRTSPRSTSAPSTL